MSQKFKRVERSFEVTKDIPDHQILLSFFAVVGVFAFIRWWEKEGSAAFHELTKDKTNGFGGIDDDCSYSNC